VVWTRQSSLCSLGYFELLQVEFCLLERGLLFGYQVCNGLQLGLVSFVTFLVFVAVLGFQPCLGCDKLEGYLSPPSVVLFELEFHFLDEVEVFA
jgi:hypothetical protein